MEEREVDLSNAKAFERWRIIKNNVIRKRTINKASQKNNKSLENNSDVPDGGVAMATTATNDLRARKKTQLQKEEEDRRITFAPDQGKPEKDEKITESAPVVVIASPDDDDDDDEEDWREPETWKNRLGRINPKRSLFLFSEKSKFRAYCRSLVPHDDTQTWFSLLIAATIVVSSIFVGLDSDSGLKHEIGGGFYAMEMIAIALFSLEVVVKSVAYGFLFVDGTPYIVDSRNVLDFILTLLGYVALLPGVPSTSYFRLMRLIRLLNLRIYGIRLITLSIARAIPLLVPVILWALIIMLIFGICFLQFIKARYSSRCFDQNGVDVLNLNETQWWQNPLLCNSVSGKTGLQCQNYNPNYYCDSNNPHTGQRNSYPNHDITRFSNIGHAMLQVIVCTSGEGWTEIMYYAMDSVSDFMSVVFVFLMFVVYVFVLRMIAPILLTVSQDVKSTEDARRDWFQRKKARELLKRGHKREDTLLGRATSYFHKATDDRKKRQMSKKVDDDDEDEARKRDEQLEKDCCTAKQFKETFDAVKVGIGAILSYCSRVVEREDFSRSVNGVIVFNAVCMAVQYYGMNSCVVAALDLILAICQAAFCFEFVMRILGSGPKYYFENFGRFFDGCVIWGGVVELAVLGSASWTSIRVLTLFQLIPSNQTLVKAIAKSLADLIYFGAVVIIFIFIYAVVGHALLGGKLDPTVRMHFDTLQWSFVTVFQIMSPENWNSNLYSYTAAIGPSGTIYTVSLYVFGNIFLVQLFLAQLIGNFESASSSPVPSTPPASPTLVKAGSGEKKRGSALAKRGSLNRHAKRASANMAAMRGSGFQTLKVGGGGTSPSENASVSASRFAEEEKEMEKEQLQVVEWIEQKPFELIQIRSQLPHHEEHKTLTIASTKITKSDDKNKSNPDDKKENDNPKNMGENLTDNACLCIGKNQRLRTVSIKIVEHKWFNRVLLLVTIYNSITLAINGPFVKQGSKEASFFLVSDTICAVVFLFEVAVKMIALGLLLHRKSYFRDGWNCLDFFIAVSSFIAIFGKSQSFRNGLKAMRALRPIRLITMFSSTREILQNIYKSFKSVARVLLFGILVFFVLAIIGVQNFGGRLRGCLNLSLDPPLPVLVDKAACDLKGSGYRWDNPVEQGNFDNIGSAMLVLFELTTQENWPTIMLRVIDSPKVPEGAVAMNTSPSIAVYFIAVIVINSFFLMDLMVGAVTAAYQDHARNMTPEQAQWLKIYRDIADCHPDFRVPKPQPRRRSSVMAGTLAKLGHQQQPSDGGVEMGVISGPGPSERGASVGGANDSEKSPGLLREKTQYGGDEIPPSAFQRCLDWVNFWEFMDRPAMLSMRLKCYTLVESEWFKNFILGIITVNTVALTITYSGESLSYHNALQRILDVGSWVFITEALLKFLAYDRWYFKSGWRRVEFLVAVCSLIEFLSLGLGVIPLDYPYINPYVFRVARILRIWKVQKKIPSINALTATLGFAVPGLVNLAYLLFVTYFVYAIIAVNLFGEVKPTYFMDQHGNFQNWPRAMLTLFRCTTGENWNGIMRDCMIQPPYCTPGVNCGSVAESVIFFVSFIVITNFLYLNVVVAIVTPYFEEQFQKGRTAKKLPVTIFDIERFARIWKEFSSDECMSVEFLQPLLDRLTPMENRTRDRVLSTGVGLGLGKMVRGENWLFGGGNDNDNAIPIPLDQVLAQQAAEAEAKKNAGEGGGEHKENDLETGKEEHKEASVKSGKKSSVVLPSEPSNQVHERELDQGMEVAKLLDLPVDKKRRVHFVDVLTVLSARVFAQEKGLSVKDIQPPEKDEMLVSTTAKLRARFPKLGHFREAYKASHTHKPLQTMNSISRWQGFVGLITGHGGGPSLGGVGQRNGPSLGAGERSHKATTSQSTVQHHLPQSSLSTIQDDLSSQPERESNNLVAKAQEQEIQEKILVGIREEEVENSPRTEQQSSSKTEERRSSKTVEERRSSSPDQNQNQN